MCRQCSLDASLRARRGGGCRVRRLVHHRAPAGPGNYWVKPDELRLEAPYLAHTIAATRYGFGLEQISVRPFPAAGTVTPEVMATNAETIHNIRWWDPRPLLETYRQLQEIRLYYDFQDVDVDRYTINGIYQEVLLSGRELNQARLAPEAHTEFVLMLPMTPSKRDNMIAWLAARCDGEHYGELVEFAFPKETLVYGPAQIEARIDQDTTISQQLSLWNQLGSRVIRGNLLVIPLEDAVLYVEPLYLSAETRELPELKRLIASSGDRVVMSQSVDVLLTALSAGEKAQPAMVLAPGPAVGGATSAALAHYRQALEALQRGDWSTFGVEMDALRNTLEGAAAVGRSS